MLRHRILIALDDTPASERAIQYTGELLAGQTQIHVHLMHVERVRTSQLQGSGEGLKQIQQQSRELLEGLKGKLVQAGLDAASVDVGFLAIAPETTLAGAICGAAEDHECGTIVVGRNSLPWHKETLHHHPADELLKKAHGVTLWIVE